jgi:hypothetical protein
MGQTEPLVTSKYNAETKTMNYITKYLGDNNIFNTDITKMNEAILNEFHAAVDWLLSKGYDEYVELVSRTINPAQQNAFLPLREYRVKRNGHYKIVSIYHRFLGCETACKNDPVKHEIGTQN